MHKLKEAIDRLKQTGGFHYNPNLTSSKEFNKERTDSKEVTKEVTRVTQLAETAKLVTSSCSGLTSLPSGMGNPKYLRRPQPLSKPSGYPQSPEAPQHRHERLCKDLKPVRGQLTATAIRIYKLLHKLACYIASRRQYVPDIKTVAFFNVHELLYSFLDLPRMTYFRNLKQLKVQNLLDYRGHKTTAKGQTLCDGTVFRIKLNPFEKLSCQLIYADMKEDYRDLEADIKNNHTAYALINNQESLKKESGTVITQEQEKLTFNLLLSWTGTKRRLTPQQSMTVPLSNQAVDLEEILDLPATPKRDRNKRIHDLAQSYKLLFQSDDLKFWLAYLWACLDLSDQGNQEPLYLLYTCMRRTYSALREANLYNPTGLLVSQLKQSKHFDLMKRQTHK